MLGGKLLHLVDEAFAFSAPPLKLFKLASQSDSFFVQFRINHGPDQLQDLLNSDWVLLENWPDDGLGIDETVGSQQGTPVSLTEALESVPGQYLRFKDENGRAHLAIIQQVLTVGQHNRRVRSVFRVRTLMPGPGILAFGLLDLRDACERRSRALVVGHLGAQFTQSQQVGLAGVEFDDTLDDAERLLLPPQFRHFA